MEIHNKFDLDTPSLVVDADKLEKNIRTAQRIANDAGIGLRPHIKTHKCVPIAKAQLEAGAVGLTCAKLSEAEIMAKVSDDIFIAYPIIGPRKLERLDALSQKAKTRTSVESIEGAQLLEDHLAKTGRNQEVMIKIECGLGRTGVAVDELENLLSGMGDMNRVDPVGVFTHEGKAYGLQGREAVRAYLDTIAATVAEAKSIFEAVTSKPAITSPGCTITSRVVEPKDDFTEIRPGTYVFADRYCVASGLFAEEDCALSVLVRVIAVKADGRVVVDGGSKTFAMDRHPELGHGFVLGREDLHFDRLSEEHGVLVTSRPEDYKVGDLLKIIPAHVCPVVNLHNTLHLCKGEEIVERWPVDARGCVR